MALSNGPNLGILVDGEIGEVHYDALMQQWRAMDALVQPRVKSATITTPPVSPSDGDCYVVPSGSSGVWSTHTNKIARYSSKQTAWEYYTPKNGWVVHNEATSSFIKFNGTAWVDPISNKADLVAGKVPSEQLPSYVDDILEFPDLASFPVTGESGKIYVAIDTGNGYRWSGSTYVKVSQPLEEMPQAVAEAGTSETLYAATARRIRQAIAAWWASITNIDGKNIGATTAGTGRFTTLTATGNTTLGDSSSDTVTVNGSMGLGGGVSLNYGLYVRNTNLQGGAQVGALITPTGTASATAYTIGVAAGARTAEASYTTQYTAGIRVLDSVKGTGSTIVNQHGILIDDQTQGTNNYGITSQVSAGTNKRNLNITGTADNVLMGNTGIGTTSPTEPLTINKSGTGGQNTKILLQSNAVSVGAVAINPGGEQGLVIESIGNYPLICRTNGVGRLNITSTGVVDVLSGQIKFPATQVASSDPNTLDDYEEGTFTPVLTFQTPGDLSVTYSTQLGRYTKVGRLVTATLTVITSTFTHTTASGTLRISGMPFVAATDSNNLASGVCGVQGYVDTTRTNLYAVMDSGTAICALRSWEQGQTLSVPQASSFPSGTQKAITITISYTV